MIGYIKLSEPPMFVLHFPTCSACDVDLEHDGDSFTCPSCGTSWDPSASDGDEGELFVSWSGEEATGPSLTHEQASVLATYRERVRLHEKWPDLFPAPEPIEIAGVTL